MFFDYKSPSIRYTGRFAEYNNAMTATAAGSEFEIAFSGDFIRLEFDINTNEAPMPHLWISLDGNGKFEVPLDKYIRVDAPCGEHILKVIYKGGKEVQPRFFHPLVGKISFKGFEAENSGVLPEDNRKTIEFVGDSITEGVLIDAFLVGSSDEDQNNRPYQDDATATYAALLAKALDLKELHMGYGAVGVTKGGCGGVPKAAEAYPFCFENAPVTYDSPDYILINHGANDSWAGDEENYILEYKNLLDVIIKKNPTSKIICLSAFLGVWPNGLKQMIEDYNRKHGTDIAFIDSTGWIPKDPLHPLRDGHKTVAEHLIPIVKEIIK